MYYITPTQLFIRKFSNQFFVDSNLVSIKNFSPNNLKKILDKTALEDWNVSSNISNKIFSFLYYLINNQAQSKIIHMNMNNSSICFEHWKDFSYLLYSLLNHEKELIFDCPQMIEDSSFELLNNFSPIDLNPILNLSLDDIDFHTENKKQNIHDIIQRLPSDDTKLFSYLSNLDSSILNDENFLSLLWNHYKKDLPNNFPAFLFENEKFLHVILKHFINDDSLHDFWLIHSSTSSKNIKNKWNFISILLNLYDGYTYLEFPYIQISKFDFTEIIQQQKFKNNDPYFKTKVKILEFFQKNLFNHIMYLSAINKYLKGSSYASLYFQFFPKNIQQNDIFFDFLLTKNFNYITTKIFNPLLNTYFTHFEETHSIQDIKSKLKTILIQEIPFDNFLFNKAEYFTTDFILSLFEDSKFNKQYLWSNLSKIQNDWKLQELFIQKNIENHWFTNQKLIPQEKILYEKFSSLLLDKKRFDLFVQLNKTLTIENIVDFKKIIELPFFYDNNLTQKKIKDKFPNFEKFLDTFQSYELIRKHKNLSKIYSFTKTIADKLIQNQDLAVKCILLNNSLENIPLKYLEDTSFMINLYEKNSSLDLDKFPNKLFFQKDFIWSILHKQTWSILKKIPFPIWQESQFLEDFFLFIDFNKIPINFIIKNVPKEIGNIFTSAEKENIKPIEIFQLLKSKRVLQQSFSNKEQIVKKNLKL